LASLVTLPACGGDDGGAGGADAGPPFEATLSAIQTEVFDKSCIFATCHGSAGAGGLLLEASVAYTDLVGAPALQTSAAAMGLARVTPGDPDQSFLVMKLVAPLDLTFGSIMPEGSPDGLDPAKTAVIRAWIAAGAANN
jgi:hypothetical protein